MVTDLSTPQWQCDICQESWAGKDALTHATECEAAGVAEPLPVGTWVLTNGYANIHGLTVGGFRMAQIEASTNVRRPGGGHAVNYDSAFGQWNLYDHGLWPHRPGVLNIAGVAKEKLHGDELSTVLRDSDVVAGDYVEMLAAFGIRSTVAEVRARTSEAYSNFWHTQYSPTKSHAFLPPLHQLPDEVQAALLAVSSPQLFGSAGDAVHDRAGRRRTPSSDRGSLEIAYDLVNSTAGAARLTRARYISYATACAEDAVRNWLAGADVYLPAKMLRYDGGDVSKPDRKLDVEQRDLLRAAGFEVRWPARIRNVERGEINTPKAALDAIVERYRTDLEVDMDEGSTLFKAEHKIGVDSGKGGVGKTTVTAALGHALVGRGHRTLLIDLDFHGPSLGSLLQLPPITVGGAAENPTIIPSEVAPNLFAVSVSQFVSPDAPIRWRSGSVEGFLLFLAARLDTLGADYIVFDFPPGTGDVESSVFAAAKPDGIVLVTTGSKLSHDDTRRAASFARGYHVPILGVVENMSAREVELPDGQRASVRLFGEEQDTIDFTASLEYDNGFGKRWKPDYLGSLPFISDPLALSAALEFEAVTAAAETPVDKFEATGEPEVRRFQIKLS